MRRGQISLEFLIIMGVATIMLVTFLVIGADQLQEASRERSITEVIDAAHSTQLELLTAASVSDGYVREFSLPSAMHNQPYSIALTNGTDFSVITFATVKHRYSVRTPLCNGTITPGKNTIVKTGGSLQCN